jgi:choline oxidase
VSEARSFDYVVVGGGTAGVIVAVRLACTGDASVCLIESGPSDAGQNRVLELARWSELYQSDLDYDYRGEPSAANADIRFSSARVLGGCSSHNNGIALLPTEQDMAAWGARGAEGWSMEELRPSIERLLSRVNIEQPAEHEACTAAFVEAAQQAGYPLRDYWLEPLQAGVSWVRFSRRGAIRQSSSVAYLHSSPAPPPTLTVMTDTTARRIVVDDAGDAVAVETSRGVVRAGTEIVVSCGALATPKLLQLSGIGDRDHLESVGVRTLVDLPGVGRHLKDHPEAVVIWESLRPVGGNSAAALVMEAVLFATTKPGPPGFEFHFSAFRGDFYALPEGLRDIGAAFSIAPTLTRPRSEGTVTLRDSDPSSPPRIDLALFTDSEGSDLETMVEGLELARRLAEQPALDGWRGPERAPGPSVATREELVEYARATTNASFHVVGSCRMGPGDDSVVDSQLRVHGVGRLRIADASVFPEIVLVNPALTCMLVGERCAEMMQEPKHIPTRETAAIADAPPP